MKPTILCVDDERNVVESMKLNLRKTYNVLTALSGTEGLDLLKKHTDVAVVVSDMRMPEMDGATFLGEVKSAAPMAVRMLLTGYSDIEAAMRAVNEGQIFRFLTKPCAPEYLLGTLAAGIEQHRLITAEQVLLQRTLLGSVRALVEVLALSNPMALGRAVRIRDMVRKLARNMDVEQPWRLEFAAMLSQVGAVSLPDETVRRLYDGETLDPEEQAKVTDGMATTIRILENIPRLEPVTGILGDLRKLSTIPCDVQGVSREARLLKASIDLDSLEARGHSLSEALDALQRDAATYGDDVLGAADALRAVPDQLHPVLIDVGELSVGMVLCEDLKTTDGVLILPRGFSVNESSREHILNFSDQLKGEIRVLCAGRDASPRAQIA